MLVTRITAAFHPSVSPSLPAEVDAGAKWHEIRPGCPHVSHHTRKNTTGWSR